MSNVIFTWVAPAGAKISDGTVTSSGNVLTTVSNNVAINFGTSSGNVKVKSSNNCSSSSYAIVPVTVGCGGASKSSIAKTLLQLYPNPTKHEINLDFSSEKKSSCIIEIFDAAGKSCLSTIRHIEKGSNTVTLNIEHLAKGAYQIRMDISGLPFTSQFVID